MLRDGLVSGLDEIVERFWSRYPMLISDVRAERLAAEGTTDDYIALLDILQRGADEAVPLLDSPSRHPTTSRCSTSARVLSRSSWSARRRKTLRYFTIGQA
jgi:hypothetical protein